MNEQIPPWLTRHIDAGGRRDELRALEISRSGDFEHATVLWRGAARQYYRQEVIYLTPGDIVIFDTQASMSDDDVRTCLERWSRGPMRPSDEHEARL
jgi:hypothetical protein